MVGGREGSEGGVDRSRGGDEGEGLHSIEGKEGSDPRGGSISLWKRQRKRGLGSALSLQKGGKNEVEHGEERKEEAHSSSVGEEEFEALDVVQLNVSVEKLASDLEEGEDGSGTCVEGPVAGEGEDVSYDLHRERREGNEGGRRRRKEKGRHVVEGGTEVQFSVEV